MNIRQALLIMAALTFAACEPPPKETFQLTPTASTSARVELADAGGYPVAVSHRDNADVSAFGIVHENYVVVWVRYENFSNRPIVIEPDEISLDAVSEKGKTKIMKIYTQGVKGDLFKTLNTSLASISQLLTKNAPDKRESATEYESIQQVLLKSANLPVNESMEGFLISAYVPAAKFILTVPMGGKTHRFELLSKKPA